MNPLIFKYITTKLEITKCAVFVLQFEQGYADSISCLKHELRSTFAAYSSIVTQNQTIAVQTTHQRALIWPNHDQR